MIAIETNKRESNALSICCRVARLREMGSAKVDPVNVLAWESKRSACVTVSRMRFSLHGLKLGASKRALPSWLALVRRFDFERGGA